MAVTLFKCFKVYWLPFCVLTMKTLFFVEKANTFAWESINFAYLAFSYFYLNTSFMSFPQSKTINSVWVSKYTCWSIGSNFMNEDEGMVQVNVFSSHGITSYCITLPFFEKTKIWDFESIPISFIEFLCLILRISLPSAVLYRISHFP